MDGAHDPSDFRPELLSVREREVLDLAVDGRTDEEISRALGITTSTVNSYWVRIRGKVGQLSRTEIVGLVLRHESGLRHADLIAENARLTASEGEARADLAQSQTDLRASRHGGWCLLALDHAPDATLVCEPPGRVVYANLQAQRLFSAEPGELEGLSLWDLTVEEDGEEWRRQALGFFAREGAQRTVVGVESALYGLRRDGENFRAILVAERFLAVDGPMAVLTVREYLGEAESVLRALRLPYRVR